MSRAASATSAATGPLTLVWGDDDFGVKQRARELFAQWSAEIGGMDHEIIDAAVANSGDALRAIGRLREALQTLPFFGSGKVVWFQSCTFLGEDRTSTAQAVTEALAELATLLKNFRWDGVRLLVSSGKVDKRRGFYKTLEKLGRVESFAAWSIDDKDWVARAESKAQELFSEHGRSISHGTLAALVANVGPDARQLANEVDKLMLFAGERTEITTADVQAVTTRNKQARAFALADALGDRDLPRLLRTLDEELWSLRTSSQKSSIGLLYGLISKIRVLILLKELVREDLLKGDDDYYRFKAQLDRLPAASLPTDKRFNPLSYNPYVLFKAWPQTRNFTTDELIRAMELLLECNQRLVGSGLDEALVLQQALVAIVGPSQPKAPGRPAAARRR